MGNTINRDMILGLPVICQETGKSLGLVEDIEYGEDHGRIKGIIVAGMGYKPKIFSIAFDEILAFGQSAVMVRSDCERSAEKKDQGHLIGRSVIGKGGQEVGTISDIIFDPNSGQIEGYEISKGIIDDLVAGRNILSGDFLPYSGEDVVVIPMEGNMELKPNNRGILNILWDDKGVKI